MSFGLVNNPVEVHTAVRETRPHFRLLHAKDRSPINYERVCQKDGVVRKGDVRRFALAAWSMVHGLATLLVEDQLEAAGYVDREAAIAPGVVRTLFRGLHA